MVNKEISKKGVNDKGKGPSPCRSDGMFYSFGMVTSFTSSIPSGCYNPRALVYLTLALTTGTPFIYYKYKSSQSKNPQKKGRTNENKKIGVLYSE